MIEFKSLQNRFFIHQALMAAANAALSANHSSSPGSSNSNHSPQDQESLEINTSSSSVYTTVSSVSSSPILQHSPQAYRAGHRLKRKLTETDILDVSDACTNSGKRSTIQQQETQKSPASFLISDILGLDSGSQPNPIAKSASHQYELNLYQQYQASLQQQYYAVLTNYLIANSAKLNQQQSSSQFSIPSQNQCNNNSSSSKHQPKLEVSPIPRIDPTTPSSNSDSGHEKCASGILSSLEQLTRKQFQDDFEIANCLSEAKRSYPTVSGPTQLPTKSKYHRGMDENEHSSNGKQNNGGMNSGSGNSSGENGKAPTVVGVDKSELPAWVFCTRYSDRPSAGPRHRKKTKTTNSSIGNTSSASSISSGGTNNAATKKTTLLSNPVVKSPKSPNSSFSSSVSASRQFHSQAAKKQQSKPTKEQSFERDAENESKIFGDDYGDEELCYDSDDSNMSGSKRPRTAFTGSQLHRLKVEFENCKYLTGEKRQYLANELNLNESQIKIWFQNKRAKIKKSSGTRNNGLAAQLMAQGLYNHGSNKDE